MLRLGWFAGWLWMRVVVEIEGLEKIMDLDRRRF